MAVLGIDVSTHAIDLVCLDEDTLHGHWQRINLPHNPAHTPAQRRYHAIGTITDMFPTRTRLEELGVWLAGIEDPHGRHAHTAKALGQITGAVSAALHLRHIHHIPIPPAEWRSELGLPGNADKAAVQAAVTALAGLPHGLPQDAYDAWAIAHAALRINTRALERSPT